MREGNDHTRAVIYGFIHKLYLYRYSSTFATGITAEDFDKMVAECAREEQERLSKMSRREIAEEMFEDLVASGMIGSVVENA